MKKILILYTSSGYGHRKIAENIAGVLRDKYSVGLVNLFEVEQGSIVSGGTSLYLWILRSWPGLWNFFYTNKFFLALTLPLRRAAAGFKSKKVLKILQNAQYDGVITTQVNASAIVSYLKKKGLFSGKFLVVFSDFHLHRYWLFDNVDAYIANIPEQKQQMANIGISPEKIFVCGITVPEHRELEPQKAAAIKSHFGITPEQKVVLVIGGGRGLGIDAKALSQLSGVNAFVILICGKNRQLQDQAEKIWAGDARKKVLGFVENMSELYGIANVVVSKPGGLSVTESLEFGLPIVVPSYLPGQEKFNFEYLSSHNLVLSGISDLRRAIEHELATGQFASELRQNTSLKLVVQHGENIDLERVF